MTFLRGVASTEAQRIGTYERNYAMLHTFEPFRQGNRDFALISRSYTTTAILDLATGLATGDFDSACFVEELPPIERRRPPSFIRLSKDWGHARVNFAVEMKFDLSTGTATEWRRHGIATRE